MTNNLTPLAVCERLVGGIEQISAICGYKAKAAYNWRHGSDLHEPGDIRSARLMRRLLAYSRSRHLGLTSEHLIHGATSAGIDRILAARRQPELARVG